MATTQGLSAAGMMFGGFFFQTPGQTVARQK